MSSTNLLKTGNNDISELQLGWKAHRKNCKRLGKLVVNVKRVGKVELSEETLQVHVKRFGKVQQIKKKVKKLTGIPIIDQTLIFSGRQLDNTERIVSLLSSASQETELTLFLLVNKNSKSNNTNNNNTSNDIAPPSVERQLETDVLTADDSTQQQQRQQQQEQEYNSSPLPSKEENIEEKDEVEEESNASPITSEVQELAFAPPCVSILKLSYEGQHRRVPFEGASFSRLTSLCTSFFGVKNVNRMIIRYRDEDGDLVQLSSDAELAYALATHSSSSSSSGAPVLRLIFSVKPVQPKAAIRTNEDNKAASAPSEMRRLRDGDVIQLSNGGFHLVLSPSSSPSSAQGAKKKNDFVIEGKKDDQSEASQWIVKKAVIVAKANDKKNGRDKAKGDEKEVIFLKNKTLSDTNKQLRVVATGEVQHSGGFGKWARFVVHYLPNGEGIQLRSVGRSLLRDHDSSSSSFLGLQLDKQQKQGGEESRGIASGTFKKTDEPSKFVLRFVQ